MIAVGGAGGYSFWEVEPSEGGVPGAAGYAYAPGTVLVFLEGDCTSRPCIGQEVAWALDEEGAAETVRGFADGTVKPAFAITARRAELAAKAAEKNRKKAKAGAGGNPAPEGRDEPPAGQRCERKHGKADD